MTNSRKLALSLMSIGSIVAGLGMVIARVRVPDNTMGQTIFTAALAAVFVWLVNAKVVGAKNNKRDSLGFRPNPSNLVIVGCMIVAIVMWLLCATVFGLVIFVGAGDIFNGLAVGGLTLCATGATMLLRQLKNEA